MHAMPCSAVGQYRFDNQHAVRVEVARLLVGFAPVVLLTGAANYRYEIVRTYPRDGDAFTQGLLYLKEISPRRPGWLAQLAVVLVNRLRPFASMRDFGNAGRYTPRFTAKRS